MKPVLPDWTVLLALLVTLALVFSLIFSQRPSNPDSPPLLWRSPTPERSDSLQI